MPASLRTPIKIATTMTNRNANAGLSKAAAATDHLPQIGRLSVASRPADTDPRQCSVAAVNSRPAPSRLRED
jgi:hypothetical protein